MKYGSWDIKCKGQSFLSFWTIYCPLTLKNSANQNFEKILKKSGDIIILHMSTINENHIMYDSRDIECDRPFLDHFFLFTSANNPKNQNLEKKNSLEISSFYTSAP